MSAADNRQVGGEHYRSQYQHWTMCADARLGYYEGQISKYVSRHKQKKGREDLEKASHFVDKLMELAQKGFRCINGGSDMAANAAIYFCKLNAMDQEQYFLILNIVNWSAAGLPEIRGRLLRYIETAYPAPASSSDQE